MKTFDGEGGGSMETQSVNPRVRMYLAQLDEALVRLPDDEAAELREQICEHLNESITPGTPDLEAARILDRLGTPATLVDETLGASAPRRGFGWPKWRRLRNVRRPTWLAVAVVCALVGAASGYTIDMAVQPKLENMGGSYGWLAPIDGKRSHSINNVTGEEMLTAVRPGHLQGYVIEVYNPSSWPETVLGATDSSLAAFADHHGHVGLAPAEGGLLPQPTDPSGYSLPVTIPPGQYYYLLASWRSERCWGSEGRNEGRDSVTLRVKVGWFTHTETIPLGIAFGLHGTPRSNRLATGPTCRPK